LIDPITDQGGFTKSRRGGDEDQIAVKPLIQPFNKTGADDEFGAELGDIEFGLQEGHVHAASIL
jgi:hypothetical protein